MQKALSDAGYSRLFKKYGIDGKFGSETQTVLNRFKKDYGLPQDGIFDDKTKTQLEKILSERTKQSTAASASTTLSKATETDQTASKETFSDGGSETSKQSSSAKKKSRKKKSSGGNKKSKSNHAKEIYQTLHDAANISSSKIGELLSPHMLESATGLINSVMSGSSVLSDTTPLHVSASINDPMAIRSSTLNGKNYINKLLNHKLIGGKSK